jgi:phenylalanyl-tRNA synthetase beta subunit
MNFSSLSNCRIIFIKWKKIRNFWSNSSNFSKSIKFSSEIYLFEFDFELIQNQIQTNKLILSRIFIISKNIKDLSFIIPKDISFKRIQKRTLFKRN